MAVSAHASRPQQPPAKGHVAFRVEPGAGLDPGLLDLVANLAALERDPKRLASVAGALRPLLIRSASKGLAAHIRKVELASGSRLNLDPRDHFAAGIAFGLLHELWDLNTFTRLARPGMTIVDAGANFGLYAIEVGRLAEGGLVVAFEPVPEIYTLLASNIEGNGLVGVVRPIEAAVCAQTGEREFHVSSEGSFSSLNETGRAAPDRTIRVAATTLDDCDALADRPVDLMKIDVEGSEWEVLRGARALIARSPGLVILCEAAAKNMSGEAYTEFQATVEDLREQGFVLYTGWHDGEPRKVGPGMLSNDLLAGNLFLARGGTEAEARLLAAFEDERLAAAARQAAAPPMGDVLDKLCHVLRNEVRRGRHLDELAMRERQERETQTQQIAAQHRARQRELEIELVAARKRVGHLEPLLQTVAQQEERYKQIEIELLAAREQLHEAKQNNAEVRREETRHCESAVRLADIEGRFKQLEWVVEQRRQESDRLGRDLGALQLSSWWSLGRRLVFPVVNQMRRRSARQSAVAGRRDH